MTKGHNRNRKWSGEVTTGSWSRSTFKVKVNHHQIQSCYELFAKFIKFNQWINKELLTTKAACKTMQTQQPHGAETVQVYKLVRPKTGNKMAAPMWAKTPTSCFTFQQSCNGTIKYQKYNPLSFKRNYKHPYIKFIHSGFYNIALLNAKSISSKLWTSTRKVGQGSTQ